LNLFLSFKVGVLFCLRETHFHTVPVRTPGAGKNSSQFSRAHLVERVSERNLRVVGCKWTTYRRMAQDALDAAIRHDILPKGKPCSTDQRTLSPNPLLDNAWVTQGQWRDEQIQEIVRNAVQEEAACNADDILYPHVRTTLHLENWPIKWPTEMKNAPKGASLLDSWRKRRDSNPR
jgi:hypothetical protein